MVPPFLLPMKSNAHVAGLDECVCVGGWGGGGEREGGRECGVRDRQQGIRNVRSVCGSGCLRRVMGEGS